MAENDAGAAKLNPAGSNRGRLRVLGPRLACMLSFLANSGCDGSTR